MTLTRYFAILWGSEPIKIKRLEKRKMDDTRAQMRLDEVFSTPKYDKDLLVYQENQLVRSKKDDLSVFQAKLLRLAIAQITRDDCEIMTYKIDLCDLAELFRIPLTYAYQLSEKEINDLGRKAIHLREKSQTKKRKNFSVIPWVARADYRDGEIIIELNGKLKPYLLGLNDYFSAYPMEEVLELDTDNAIKLYELLSSFRSQLLNQKEQEYYGLKIEKDEAVFPVSYLREYFNCENVYVGRDRDFIKYVIDVNVAKINLCEPIKVSYRRVRKRIAHNVYEPYVVFKFLTYAAFNATKPAKQLKGKKATK